MEGRIGDELEEVELTSRELTFASFPPSTYVNTLNLSIHQYMSLRSKGVAHSAMESRA